MHDFLLKEIYSDDLKKELDIIGFDDSYSAKAVDKFRYKNIKLYNLSVAQANILKQAALSVGADCATNKQVITGQVEKSDCILGGSISQLIKISQKLEMQPFGLKELGKLLKNKLSCNDFQKTKIMGILNITQNSFSDGGEFYDFEDSIKQLNKLITDGADIIDIGAESAKPYSSAVQSQKQLDKLLPVLCYIKENDIKIPVSIDTRSAYVAQKCIETGVVAIINDVSGFDYDEKMVDVIAQNPKIKIVIQHSLGTPENMQNSPHYENLMDEIYKNLYKKVNFAIEKGIQRENIIIDPGIGFGKTKENNFEILRRWKELKTIGTPVLIGLSRKSLLDMQNASNEEKDIYSLALNSVLISENIDYVRVHNVKIHKKFRDIWG
ncbi:dihydropteroate synthase [bacterium]|nr:dihydropteroate synthase [bacterium]